MDHDYADEKPTAPMRTTITPAPIDFAIIDRRGYWLTPTGWGEHRDAKRFNELLDAATAASDLSANYSIFDRPAARPWDVAEGYRAVVEPCTTCQGTGREPETCRIDRKRGWTERACLSCNAYGTRAIFALNTVQFTRGGVINGTPVGDTMHLVRKSLNGFDGSPGPLLCGIHFRAKGVPACCVGGGYVGPSWTTTPCTGCASAARADFTGLPVFGDVGAPEMAALIGADHRDDRDYRRPWRHELNEIRTHLYAARRPQTVPPISPT
jgi:hypothetical protein